MSSTAGLERTPTETAPRGGPLSGRLVRAGAWSSLGHVASLVISFISVPIVIRLLGAERYGIYTLIVSITGYLGFADFGMGLASTRFAALAHEREGDRAESRSIWTAALLGIAISGGVALALAAGAPYIAAALLPRDLQHVREATIALAFSGASLVFSGAAGVFNTPQLVRLRYDVSTKINVGAAVLMVASQLLALWCWPHLVAAVVTLVLVSIAILGVQAWVSFRLLPALRKPEVDRGLVRPMLRLGGAVVIAALVGTVTEHGERFLLARLADAETLAHYAVAASLTRAVAQLCGVGGQTLLPAFSRLLAGGDREQLDLLFNRAVRGLTLLLVPALSALVAISAPVLALWVGPSFRDHAALPLQILAVGWFSRTLAQAPRVLLTAAGEAHRMSRYNLFELLPYAVLMYGLISRFGAAGAAAAWSIRVTAEAAYLFWAARRAVGVHLRPWKDARSRALSCGGAAVLVGIAIALVRFEGPGLVRLVLAGSSAVAFLGLGAQVLLTPHERAALRALAAKVVRRGPAAADASPAAPSKR